MNRPVQACFDRGAAAYLQLAQAQLQMTERLWHWCPPKASQVLDLGCGPGHWSARLAEAYPVARVLGVDLSHGMLQQAREQQPELSWIQADAARLPLAAASMDLVFSSLMLQWCPDPLQVLQEIHRVLKPGGQACLATLLPGSLLEIDRAWRGAGLVSQVLDFHAQTDWRAWIEAGGLQCLQLEACPAIFYYADPRQLLASVAGIGAGAAAWRQPLTPGCWRRIAGLLEQHRQPQGLPLTYRLLLMKLQKT